MKFGAKMGLVGAAVIFATAWQVAPFGGDQITEFVLYQATAPTAVDPFTGPDDSPVEGREIRFEAGFKMKGEGAGYYTWEYDRAREELKLSVLPHDFGLMTAWRENGDRIVGPRQKVVGFQTSYTHTREAVERRQNAYGAAVDVEVFRDETVGFAGFGENHESPLPGRPRYFYEHSLRLAPEAARAMTADLRLVVTGRATNHEGRSVVCGSNYSEPSIRNPRETLGRTCVLPADIDIVAFVDGRTGTVLREWR